MTEDIIEKLCMLGRGPALFQRIHAAERALSKQDDDDDADDDWGQPDGPGFLEDKTIRDGYRFASALAATRADTESFAWVVWARSTAPGRTSGMDDGYSTPDVLERRLMQWLRYAREREEPATYLGRLERLAGDRYPRPRVVAAKLLTSMDSPQARALLLNLAADPHPWVREQAKLPDIDDRFGLLPRDADPEACAGVGALDDAVVKALVGTETGETLVAALSAVPDSIACVVLPRLIYAGVRTTEKNIQVMKSLFARAGGPKAFVAEVLPGLEPAGASTMAWSHNWSPCFEGLDEEARNRVVAAFLPFIEQNMPHEDQPRATFEPTGFLSEGIAKLAPVDPTPLVELVAKVFADSNPRSIDPRDMTHAHLLTAIRVSREEKA